MLSKLSVKKPYTVIVGIILVIVLGVISFQHMSTDLLPSMNLPYVVVYTTYSGATPEQVESEVTRPMEASFATLTDIKKLTSQSRDNMGVVIMQFNDGANMDTAMIEISSKLDQLEGSWDDDVGSPVALKLNPDMLPVTILSVARDDMDILALSDYVNDELIPAFEGLNGVAEASASGVIEQEVDVTIEQSRIDVVNSVILEEIDEELADVEKEINAAQAEIADGWRTLANTKAVAYNKIDQAEESLDKGEKSISSALETQTAQRDALQEQRDSLAETVEALESVDSMTDEDKATVLQSAETLTSLRAQKTALEEKLSALQSGDSAAASEMLDQRTTAQTERDALNNERDALNTYIDELKLLDETALAADITRLTTEIADDELALNAAQDVLKSLKQEQTTLQAEVNALKAKIDAATKVEEKSGQTDDAGAGEGAGSEASGQTSDAANGSRAGKDDGRSEAHAATAAQGAAIVAADAATQVPAAAQDSEAQQQTATTSDETTQSVEAVESDAPARSVESAGDAAETKPEATADAEPEAKPEADTKQDTGSEPETEGKSESDAKSEGEEKSEAKSEAKSESKSETKSENKSESKSEAKSENRSEPEAKSEPVSEAQPASRPEAQAESKSEAKSENKSEPEAKSEPESEPQPAAQAEPQSEAHAEPEAQSAPESVADAPAAQADPAPEAQPEAAEQSARLSFGRAMAEGESLSELNSQLETAQSKLDEVNGKISAKEAEIAAKQADIDSKEQEKGAKQDALDTLKDNNEDITARKQEAEANVDTLDNSIAALDEQIAALDTAIAAEQGSAGEIATQLSTVEAQIAALEDAGVEETASLLNDPDALASKYDEAKSSLDTLDESIATLNTLIEKLSNGIIPGGYIDGIDEDTNLSESRAALKKARSELEAAFSEAESALYEAEKTVAKARSEFNEKREDAFKDAGLDGVITVSMVSQIIASQNLSMPAGYVEDEDGERVLVRVGNKYGSIDEMRRMKLFNLDMDNIKEVRMLDVASVKLTDDRDDVFTKLDGQDGILLSLEKQSTYSTADVADTIMAKAKELQEADPHLEIVDLMNQGEYIDLVVDSVLNNLLSGGGLAILVLLLFLLDWRPTLTVAFSIPISVVIAFVAMYFSGITLNVLSLSGLALGIGMLVDNSIVSIENIYRLHDEERLPLLRSCVEGVRSVSGALFSSTLTTICVFLPIVFVQGMARDLFADMGLTIAFSLLASLLVAMTVVPMMCSFLMRRSKPRKHRIFSKIQSAYGAMLRGALRFKPLVLLVAVALLVVSGMQVTKMGISFMPEVNSRQMSAELAVNSDMSDSEQKAQATQIMTDMLALPGVQSIGLMDGSGSLLSSGGGYSYYIIVDETAGVKNVDIARQIEAIGERYGAELTAQSSTMDISMMTGSGITVEITGDDIEVLQDLARDVAALARSTEGVADVDDGMEDAVPELRITVDKDKAVDESLTTAQVYSFIAQKLMEKTEVGKVTLDGKEMKIQLIEGRNQGILPGDIENLEYEVDKEDEDTLVRIGNIAEITDATSLSTIHRASQRRMVSVTFGIADGYSANLVSDAFEAKLKQYNFPEGYRAELSGENETVMGIMEDLVWMILVAVLLIFLIMVAQFQSFKSPIIVMFTIPLAFTGGMLALLLTGMDLSIVAMLGFLVLSGVVVNNGIVFIDCVNQLRIAGWEKRDALVEAGRQRLRPILMTALTTILGMSTMALGHGTGAEMMQPMAVVSIGGLTYATLMTLFVVPVLYDLFNGRKMKAREIQMIREAAGMNGDALIDGSEPVAPAPVTPAPVAPAPAEKAAASVEGAPVVLEPEVAPDSPVKVDDNAPPVPVFAPRPAPAPVPPEPDEAPKAPVTAGTPKRARPIRVQLNPPRKR